MVMNKNGTQVTLRAFVLGALLAGVFAWITVLRDNFPPVTYLSANLIPVLPHVMLFLTGLLINPLLRWVPFVRPFGKSEKLLIFVMCAVSSGLASFGLSGQLVPVVSGLSNEAWNTEQSQWDVGVMPFLNERYFISGEGTQAAAQRLRSVSLQYDAAQRQYRNARDYLLARTELAEAEAERAAVIEISDAATRTARELTVMWSYRRAVTMHEKAQAEWERVAGDEPPEVVVETFSAKIDELKAERDQLRVLLREMNAEAAEAVTLVRKGLPAERRAFPGFLYTRGEGWGSYAARIQRLRVGGQSRKILEKARVVLADRLQDGTPLPQDWQASLRKAAALLEPISEIPSLAQRDEKLRTKLAVLEDRLAAEETEFRHLMHLQRYASQGQISALAVSISEAEERIEKLRKQTASLRDEVDLRIAPLLEVCSRVKATQAALADMAAAASPEQDRTALLQRLDQTIDAYVLFDASARRFWLSDVPWKIWLVPVLSWVLIVFVGYAVFMTFITLIHRQWSHNEKLIYPLAEVATLLCDGGKRDQTGKSLFTSGLFWTGFAVSAGVLGWNYMATNNIVPNINPVKLQTLWLSYMGGGILRALGSTYFCIIFAVIGLSFLVPAKISFSLWFFEVLYMGLLIVMVTLGYGDDRWSLGNVGRSGIGAGAMVVFGFVILWACRQYLLCAFKPDVLKNLEPEESRELRRSSVIFLVTSGLLIVMMSVSFGANPLYAVAYYLLMLVMTIALVRAVAEGGLLGITSFVSIFTILRVFFGASMASSAAITIVSGFLFGGLKFFLAPMMANALKIREQIEMRRPHFHGAVWTGIVVTTIVATVALIMLSYQHGADNLGSWLNSKAPQGTFDGVKGFVETTEGVKATEKGWMVTGAVLMGGLLFLRRRVAGVPHPIGLLMIMNPNMFGFWGSYLIGWLFKSMVSKYCSHVQYVSIRRFFIGLVLGHLAAILFGWQDLNFHWG